MSALATDVNVVALIRGKATLVIDGGAPRTLAVGQSSPEGVKLIAADADSATVEVDGKRETIEAGGRGAVVAASVNSGGRSVTLYPDSQGHFSTYGTVDGTQVHFMVDSGATTVVLPAAEAKRVGIDYLRGKRGTSMTANGAVGVFHVMLDSVKVGQLELKQVDADVIEGPMTGALLGMSFLGRLEMQRDSQYMRLSQRDAANSGGKSSASGRPSVVLDVQRGGHFFTPGSINGSEIGFVVDTGATMVSISVADARRMGINYLNGRLGSTMTANGRVSTHLLKFDEVKVGGIVLRNVDGAVLDGNSLPVALLGMSFLNRTEIRRDGAKMTLTQRF